MTIDREPKMSSDTWRAFCKSVLTMVEPPTAELKEDRPEFKFKCDRCSMEFQTAMKLDGILHKAIQNKCGGMWKIQGDGAK